MEKKRYKTLMFLLYMLPACLLGLTQLELGAVETETGSQAEQHLSEGGVIIAKDELIAYNGNCCGYESSCCSYDQGCCYYEEPCQDVCQTTPCNPCVENECCEKVEYVDYTPYEDGMDPGLYCLPFSTCSYSCPTKPSGAQLYAKQGRLAHKLRYNCEYSPQEWRTIMLHMRSILPMTACSYRKILSFMQERPYKPAVDPASTVTATSDSSSSSSQEMAAGSDDKKGSKSIAKKSSKKEKLLADAFGDEGDAAFDDAMAADEVMEEDEELSLEEMVGPIDTSGVNLMTSGAVGGGGWMPKFSHVFSGYMYLDYTAPTSSYFGDFDGTNSFSYVVAPVFLTSYGDDLLFYMKLASYNFGQENVTFVPITYITYFYNDFLTVRAGKLDIPFGNYFRYFLGWVDKCATSPMVRTFFEDFSIVPNIDIGMEISGAIPLCCMGSWFNQASFTYQLYAVNGPSEVNAFTPPEDRYPPGALFLNIGSGNSPNNNNDTTFGGRLAFLPNDCTVFGFSYLRGRWNSNAVMFGQDPAKSHYFEAAAFDWLLNITRYVKLCGEYIWTQYENNHNEFTLVVPTYPDVELAFPPSPMFAYPWVTNSSYWAMVSFDLGGMRCICPSLYWCKPCLWDSLELALRSEQVWAGASGKTFLWNAFGGFDYTGFYKRRFTVCLGYYFTQTFSVKFNYDINYGETGDNFLYQTTTGTNKKTGYAQNVFTFRLVWGW